MISLLTVMIEINFVIKKVEVILFNASIKIYVSISLKNREIHG
jgi:hypothetical protein